MASVPASLGTTKPPSILFDGCLPLEISLASQKLQEQAKDHI